MLILVIGEREMIRSSIGCIMLWSSNLSFCVILIRECGPFSLMMVGLDIVVLKVDVVHHGTLGSSSWI